MLRRQLRSEPVDFSAIRAGLTSLPRTNNHSPDQTVEPQSVFTPPGHRNALDPDRTLVVGNRGMGKSFWAHALRSAEIRAEAAKIYRQPQLNALSVVIGFNASERTGDVAPPRNLVTNALESGFKPELIWRTVLLRAVASETRMPIGKTFTEQCRWVMEDLERYAEVITDFDARLHKRQKKLLLVFDALDLLGDTWEQKQLLLRALLSLALSAKSYRAIRFKLFMRPDQYADSNLFTFPDASKIKNDRVDLTWQAQDLYGLLFLRLLQSSGAGESFKQLMASTVSRARVTGEEYDTLWQQSPDEQKQIVDALAGEFMGSTAKRGRVYTWLPTHLGDALGETSPRTFLTAWQVAARHGPPPSDKAVDHLGLSEGVRKASEDRLSELQQDYPWINVVLSPLAGESVPMLWPHLEAIWRRSGAVKAILSDKHSGSWAGPLPALRDPETKAERVLLDTLCTIGVFERRANDKVNVPDIFRVEARIKRRGGVKPPRAK